MSAYLAVSKAYCPTHIGQQLLLHAKEVLNTTQIMQQEVNAAHGIQQGTLRIGSFWLL